MKIITITLSALIIAIIYIPNPSEKDGIERKEEEDTFKPTAQTHSEVKRIQNTDKLLNSTYSTAVHEAAHYIIYMKSSEETGYNPTPIEVSIVEKGNTAGHFSGEMRTYDITILSSYAGFATECVFFNQSPQSVFEKMQDNGYDDYKIASEAQKGREVTKYQDFLDTIEWVKKYRNEIAAFAERLQKEKIIKFHKKY